MNTATTETIYEQLGISKEVWAFGQKTEEKLKERFEEFDRNAEYNQLKVIHAMQENRVSEGCFQLCKRIRIQRSGTGILWKMSMPAVFHTEAALVRPQITCGTHALALALAANLRPGDELLSPVGKPYDTLGRSNRNPSIQRLSGRIWNHLSTGRTCWKTDILIIRRSKQLWKRKQSNWSTIQRSKGYQTRPSYSVDKIGELIAFIKERSTRMSSVW